MTKFKSALAVLALCGLPMFPTIKGRSQQRDTPVYDLVILNGRVMDPESGLDAVRNVGIDGGKIRAISTQPLRGRETIDAKGLVVAPGFIDMHEHGQTPANYRYQARDGVTTSLELEIGTSDVDKWYAERKGKALINYGVSAGHVPVRSAVFHDPGVFLPTGPAIGEAASPEQLNEIKSRIEHGLDRGALAVGMGIAYTPGASHEEIAEVFRVAAKYHALVEVHIRYASLQEPQSTMDALDEVIADAAASGARLQVCHITSMGMRDTPELMKMIKGARSHGVDVTTEAYPYSAASTRLDSAVFAPGWQKAMGITYKDLQWTATGERLNAESFARYRKQGGFVVIYSIPEEVVRQAMADPNVIVITDGMPFTGGKIHPRGQGTHARVLGKYVREEHALSLMTALRKMTLLPAEQLEQRDPEFRNKGRIRVGADADLTIFDPARVIDKATYANPLQYSEGIPFVLVNGVPVVQHGKLIEGVFPGQPARAPISSTN